MNLSQLKNFLILFSALLVNCSGNQKTNVEPNKGQVDQLVHEPQVETKTRLDTVLERNNPSFLDLSKHQIFIDTTRNSKYYDKISGWTESKWDIKTINYSLHEINTRFQPTSIDLVNFPVHFVTLRKLNNEFVLYSRCDGIDPRFEIRDTAFIFYGPLEPDAESISKLLTLTDNKLQLELRTFMGKSDSEKSILTIEKIRDFVYQMTYENQTFIRTEYLTTIDRIQEFDLVVNHCPTRKVLEYDGFD